ncbi:MAG: hypothetical protein QF393_12030, partial [Rhodospirillales bacterium]|nr:hypothetical protein [Rhodospirillales bacterium]
NPLQDPPISQRPIIGNDHHAIKNKTALTVSASYKRTLRTHIGGLENQDLPNAENQRLLQDPLHGKP